MALKTPVFQFGGMTSPDFRRVAKQVRSRGLGSHEPDMEIVNIALAESYRFGQFSIAATEFLKSERQNLTNEQRQLDIDSELPAGEFSKIFWNHRARVGAIFSDFLTEITTFQSLMEKLRSDERKREEVILSLGSGFSLLETYFANFFQIAGFNQMKMVCLDSAEEVTLAAKVISRCVRIVHETAGMPNLANLAHISGEMEDLPFPDKSVDQIICLDALQWSGDWRKAVDEMARVIDPEGLGNLYLSVRIRPISILTPDNQVFRRVGDFSVPELLDYLERRRFKIRGGRQILKMGQRQTLVEQNDRFFIHAGFKKAGVKASWRTECKSLALLAQRASGD
jgi:SAM-dependent methyltransferase